MARPFVNTGHAAINAGVALRDVEEFVRHVHTRTTTRETARRSLDRGASCPVMQYIDRDAPATACIALISGVGSEGPAPEPWFWGADGEVHATHNSRRVDVLVIE